MPLPKPKKDESYDEFMDRCMSDNVMKNEYPDNDQRYAVCESQWDSSKKKNKKSDNPEMEVRDFSPDIGELRLDDSDKPKIIGYATKYGNFYDLGWFKERIKAGAFDDVMDDDVRCLKNHDPNLILGRTTNKTLRLTSNSIGLKFENDLPDTTTGKDTREEIRRGDISGCSFAFTVAEDDWKYFDDDRPSERTIVKIGRLFDVGPVVYPANPETSVVARDTTVAVRSLEQFKKQNVVPAAPLLRDAKQNDGAKRGDVPAVSDETKRGDVPVVSDETKRGDKLTFDQKFEYQKSIRKAERLRNRLKEKQQAEA